MTTTVAFVTIMVVLLGFVDFLLGDKANRTLKDWLANFYVTLDESDWTVLYRAPAEASWRFMNSWFGPQLFSWKRLLRTAILSMCTVTLIFIGIIISNNLYLFSSCKMTTACFAAVRATIFHTIIFYLAIFVASDMFAWFGFQKAYDAIRSTRTLKSLTPEVRSKLLFSPLMVLAPFFSPWLISFSLFIKNPSTCGQCLLSTGDRLFLLVPLQCAIPSIVFAASCTFTALIACTRPVLRRPLMLFAERLDSSSKHVLILIGAFFTGIGTIILALLGKK